MSAIENSVGTGHTLRPALLLSILMVTLPVCAQETMPASPVSSSTTTASADARPIIGILKFQDETGAMFLQGGAGRAMTTMLTNELSARPVFEVVERQKLKAVIEEQNLSASGRVSPETSIAIGKLTGAQFLVTGTVTAFDEKVDTQVNRGFMGYGGSVKTVSEGGYLAVDLRVIDTTTGEIRFARTIEGHTPPGEVKNGAASPLGGGPDPRAVRAAVIEIVDYLECAMVRRDSCLAEYDAKDKQRQDETRKAMQIQR